MGCAIKPSILKVNYLTARYALNYRSLYPRELAHLTTSQITLVFSFKASRKADLATSVRITEECHNTSGGAKTLPPSVSDADFSCTLDCA